MTEETTTPEIIKIGAYKLKEIALIEGIHYQTVLERKRQGMYVAIVTRPGVSGTDDRKESYRYLTAEASNAFRAIIASFGSGEVFCPDVPTKNEDTF